AGYTWRQPRPVRRIPVAVRGRYGRRPRPWSGAATAGGRPRSADGQLADDLGERALDADVLPLPQVDAGGARGGGGVRRGPGRGRRWWGLPATGASVALSVNCTNLGMVPPSCPGGATPRPVSRARRARSRGRAAVSVPRPALLVFLSAAPSAAGYTRGSRGPV